MYKGIPASDGIAVGKVLKLEKEHPTIIKKQIKESEMENQKNLLAKAISVSKKQLQDIQSISGEVMRAILDTHIMMLEDIELINMIHSKIENEYQDVISATEDSIHFFADMLESLEDEYMKERALDMRDIGYRLIMNLLGKEIISLSTLKEPVIVVAEDITPSDTAQMTNDIVLGFLTDVGGRTSHTAIMAKTLEIPAIVGLGNVSRKIFPGDIVCFDGEEGIVYVNPSEEKLKEYQLRKELDNQEQKLLEQYRDKKSLTLDGHRVEIAANICHPKDVNHTNRNGADGIGLYRTEFLYMDRESMPTEEEQFEAYKSVLEEMHDKPVVIRTLDIGGDKKLPYLPLSEEMNPFLGYRAIRICLDRQEIFETQLRALLRASVYGNLKIMYPMISSLEEVRLANAILENCKRDLDAQGIPYSKFEVGIMIEIPAAALSADLIATEVDFFSIGTNDLIQYTCAADRMNEKIASLYNPFHPALLRLIKQVIETAHENNIWCGICGEAAADKRLIPLYLAMGLDEFSMSAGSIPKARKQITNLSITDAERMLSDVLKMKTAQEIEAYMNEHSKIFS